MKSDYIVLVKGPIKQDEIQVIFNEESKLDTSKIEKNEINVAWRKIKKRSKKNGVTLFDGTLFNLMSWSQDGVLRLIIRKTQYKYYVTGLEIVDSILKEKLVSFFPLSFSALIISKDGYVLLGERSGITFMDQKKIHLIPAGHPELRKTKILKSSKSIDLFEEILRETKEELGITTSHIDEIMILGIIQNVSLQKPEIIFQIKSNLNADEIIKTFKKSKDVWEHKKLHCINADKEFIIDTIKNNSQISDMTNAALHLFLGMSDERSKSLG